MKKIYSVLVGISCFTCALAQQPTAIKGHLNGSFESYTQNYMKDDKIGASVPADKVGSNNFFKLDYTYGKLLAGIQYESYAPAILGYYPNTFNQSKLVNRYIKYTDKTFSLQVGDFYEQFGSGLIFRSFENRQIGINNALEGVNVFVQPTTFLKLKALYGRTRKQFDYANSIVRGTDVEFDMAKLIAPKSNIIFNLGGSYIGKFEEYTGPLDDYPTTTNAYAVRAAFGSNNFSADIEFVQKEKDPHLINAYSFDDGKVLLVNTSFTKNNFGISATFRALKNMDFRSERDNEVATFLSVNYVPALTKQHDNLTSNVYVYNAQPRSETGFQTDIFYSFKPGTTLGGRFGTKVSANFSYYGSLQDNKNILSVGTEKYFSDASLEIKKKLSKKTELTVTLQNLYYNSLVMGTGHQLVNAYVAAVGVLHKITPQKAIKLKLEHLAVEKDTGNWASIITEFTLAKGYSFYASDMYYYYNDNQIHYYNVGASVSKNATRFSLAFGRQRFGLFCVGGVCRFVPASYGFTATLTTSFGY